MRIYLKAYAGTFVALLILDGIWLGLIMASYYKSELGDMMRDTPKWLPAAVFYLAYPVGLVIFGGLPGLAAGSWQKAALLSALLGLIAYGTYDMTNLSTLRGWPLGLSLIDMAWGTFASAVAGTVGYLVADRL